MIGRGWLCALIIFGVGVRPGRRVGLSAAVLFVFIFTFYFDGHDDHAAVRGGSGLAGSRDRHAQAPGQQRRRRGAGRFPVKWIVILGVSRPAARVHRPVRDLRQRGQERRVPAAERVQARPLDRDQHRPARHEHQQGRALPVPRRGADHVRSMIYIAKRMAGPAEQRPDRGRGRLRPHQQQHHARQHGRPTMAAQVVPVHRARSSSSSWFSNMIGYIPLPTNTEHTFDIFGARDPVVRDLRGHGEHLDPAGADAGRLVRLPRRGHPGARASSAT